MARLENHSEESRPCPFRTSSCARCAFDHTSGVFRHTVQIQSKEYSDSQSVLSPEPAASQKEAQS